MKRHGYVRPLQSFAAIHMPSNTAAGFIIAALSAVCGFALIWHMWLLAVLGFAGMLIAIVIHTFNYHRDHFIPAEQVVRTEGVRTRLLESHV
jgi:cytochrome o ubiquinol oxidase subunit 1